jgi:hypothetical protein
MLHVGVEGNHCKGLFFELAHTVEQAIETLGVAKSKLWDPPGSL